MKKFSKIVLVTLLSLTLLAAFALTACGTSKVTITLSKTELTLSEGGAKGSIVATVTGSDATGEWSVDKSDVVSIQALGLVCTVTPLKQGTAVVTVKIGDKQATCTVTVTEKEEVEVVTITLDGAPVTSLSMVMGDVKDLAATTSKGSAVTWETDDENVATVNNGKVTAVRPGTTIVRASVSNKVKAEVSVTVAKTEGSDYYDLKFCAEGGTADMNDGSSLSTDEFFYWSARSDWGQQQVEVSYAYYENGKISFAYTCDTDTGYNYGFQLMYKHSGHTVGNYYKLSCKINIDQDCKVNLNGNDVELKEGNNDLVVYYKYTDALGSGNTYGISSFDLVMGYVDGTAAGVFVQNAVVSVSDVKWEEDTARVQLAAPSFTISDAGIISITDTNAAGVGGYLLNVYDGENLKTTISVEDGKKIDTSRVAKGTYTVKLVATAANTHYIDSNPSTGSATLDVSTDPRYTLNDSGAAGAKAAPGTWTYWTESWVEVTEKLYDNNKVTLTFGNNTGNWYDTQLFYQAPDNAAGKTYKLKVTINSTGAGRVTISKTVVTLQEGEHEYEVTYTEDNDPSFTLVMGVNNESNQQEIPNGTIVVSNLSFTEEEPEPIEGDVAPGGEVDSVSNVGKWIYWAGRPDWGANGTVTVSNAALADGVLTLTYTATEGTAWYGMQLFYKNASNVTGKKYKLTLKINASVAGDITVNGKVVTLAVGDNDIVVDSYQEAADKASVSIQFGKDGGSTVLGGTFAVSDVAFAEVEGGSSEGGDESGSDTPVEDPYAGLTPSNPSTVAISGDFANNDENNAVANAGNWIYWYDQNWWCGAKVTMSTAKIENSAITLKYTAEGNCWFGVQLFYKKSGLTAGNKYQLTLKINSTVAGDITVNGKVITLVVGDNEVKVNYTEAAGNASISIQFGNQATETMLQNGEFAISDVVVYDLITEGGSDAPVEGGDEGDDEGGSAPIEGAATVELTFVEFYGEHYFHFRAVSTYDMTNIDYVKVNGTQRACEVTDNTNGNYTLKMYVAEQVVAGEYTFEWVKDGVIVAIATYTYAG